MLEKYPLTGVTLVGRSPVAGVPVTRFREALRHGAYGAS